MISARLYQKIARRDIGSRLCFLRKSQFWPYERVREFQFAKLKRILEHSYLHVPYYRRLFLEMGAEPREIRNFEDFQKIPVLTKDLITMNAEDLVAANMAREELLPNATGGSTGEPLHFFQDRNYESWADAARIRGLYDFAGCRYGDTSAILWGAMHEVKEDFSLLERARDYVLNGEIWLNAFNLSEERKRVFLRLCRIFRPIVLRGYVTAVKDFALFLDDKGEWFPRLKAVVLGAETLDDSTRALVERVFRCPSFNTYGGRELSLIASECAERSGLHEIAENNYVELEKIDLTGYEKAGNIIVTNLNNYAMPFIRYRIGDMAVKNGVRSCPCGRGLPIIEKVVGRTTEVLVFHDGTRIAGELFIHLMKDFPVREYQFVQVSSSKLLLRIKKSDQIGIAMRERIAGTYAAYLPQGVEIIFENVESFQKTATGKFRFVLRKMAG